MALITTARPFVTVIVATYNYGCFIEDALASVINQTFPRTEREIIVVDDGSTDDTSARLRKYHGDLKYLYTANRGQASAWNVGIARARGEIIAFLDADDYWHAAKLTRVAAEFARSATVDVVSHYVNLVDTDHEVIGAGADVTGQAQAPFARHPLENHLEGRTQFFPPTSGITVRMDCLRKIMPIHEGFRVCADGYLVAVLPFYGREFALIREVLGSCRIHGDNLWTLRPPTVEHLTNMVKMNSLAGECVERAARQLGYDSTLLKQRFASVTTDLEMQLYTRQGRTLKALRKALASNDPMWRGKVLFQIYKAMTRVLSVLLPHSTYRWLRAAYHHTPLVSLLDRLRK